MNVALMSSVGKHMGLNKVHPKDLEFGQMYVSVAKVIDDYTGEVSTLKT